VGTGAEFVTVEARFDRHERERTEIVLTGLPDPVLRESKGRLECALRETGLALPQGRLFLNLVPAARRKSGEILDLPLALAAAAASGHVDERVLRQALFLGELGIDGRLHAVAGGLAAAIAARDRGVRRLFAPPATAGEAASIPELEVHGARNLAQVVAHLVGHGDPLPRLRPATEEDVTQPSGPSLDDVRGLADAKWALAVAAAGGHGILFVGPPGAGKSMLARRLVRLLPPPTMAERLEITRVLSASGRWPGGLARERPFRAPHHTTSHAGLVGGGAHAHPGEISLAHGGVLFLDELPEFRREVLESLRQPLESGCISISRAARHVELPARFQLVAAMNPCPCGYRGHPRVTCSCAPSFVQRYRRRISGPLLDRIDLVIEIAPPSIEELAPRSESTEPTGSPVASPASSRSPVASPASSRSPVASPESSRSSSASSTSRLVSESTLRGCVGRARAAAESRGQTTANAALDAKALDQFAPLDEASRAMLAVAVRKRGLSARAVQSLRRVARTCADLDDGGPVTAAHVSQALGLRAPLT